MSLFIPDDYYKRVDCIPFEYLLEHDVRCILIDRDNTCVPRTTKRVPPEILAWFNHVQHELHIPIYVVSNNVHVRQVQKSARELGCEALSHAMKPSPRVLTALLRKLNIKPQNALMIGDQIFTDIVAGRLAQTQTILVRPQSRRDLWYTYFLRVLEFFIVRNKNFKG